MPWYKAGLGQRDKRVEENPTIRDVWISQRLGTSHIAAQADQLSTINTQLIGLTAKVAAAGEGLDLLEARLTAMDSRLAAFRDAVKELAAELKEQRAVPAERKLVATRKPKAEVRGDG